MLNQSPQECSCLVKMVSHFITLIDGGFIALVNKNQEYMPTIYATVRINIGMLLQTHCLCSSCEMFSHQPLPFISEAQSRLEKTMENKHCETQRFGEDTEKDVILPYQQSSEASPLHAAPVALDRNDGKNEDFRFTEPQERSCSEVNASEPSELPHSTMESSTVWFEGKIFQQKVSEWSDLNSSALLELSRESHDAYDKKPADDYKLEYLVMSSSDFCFYGCPNGRGIPDSSTEPLSVYPVFSQSLKRRVGALERLAATSTNPKDSSAYSVEVLRLSSFLKWPHVGKISALKFSSAGFHYSGPSDTVTCHCCTLSLRDWTANVQPLNIHRQMCQGRCPLSGDPALSSNVPMSTSTGSFSLTPYQAMRAANVSPREMNRTTVATAEPSAGLVSPTGRFSQQVTPPRVTVNNVSTECGEDFYFDERGGMFSTLKDPLKIFQNSDRETLDAEHRQQLHREELCKFESYRLKSYNGMWQHGHIVKPRELAKCGFHYTGPADRVQCAFCQGALKNWEEGDKPDELHAKHFNYCRFVQGHDVGNVPIPFWSLSETTNAKADDSSNVPGTNDLGIFSSTPKHEDFAVESRRISTFLTWSPLNLIRAEDLAHAGFFFTGIGDTATCFYCNGTVSGWKADSDPWVEHARRFPACPYLLQVKGRGFVEQQSALMEPALSSSGLSTNFTVDPREIRARIDTATVRIILKMDYPSDLVRNVIQRRLSTTGRDYGSSEELLADIFVFHDENQRSSRTSSDTQAGPTMPVIVSQSSNALTGSPGCSDSALVATAASAPSCDDSRFLSVTAPNGESTSLVSQKQPPEEENRQLRTQLTCKICMDAVVGIIFLPCGHLVSCAACAPALTSCPICRVSVRGTARVTF